MKIIGSLKLHEGTGYMIVDGDVTYPIMEQSLHVKEILDALIESGYKLVALPFDLRKDDISIQSLPVLQDYEESMSDIQDMFDINSSDRYTYDELRQMLSMDDVEYVKTPESHYIINTREQLIRYLGALNVAEDTFAGIPLNYFVHPSALFTFEEYLSGKYSSQFLAIQGRRHMSYKQYLKSREWLGLDSSASAADYMEAYYAWGIDGFQFGIISKTRKTSDLIINLHTYADLDASESIRMVYALVDSEGKIYVPTKEPRGTTNWYVAYQNGKEDRVFIKKVRNLKPGYCDIVPIKCGEQVEYLQWDGIYSSIKATFSTLYLGTTPVQNFVVYSMDESRSIIPERLLSRDCTDRLQDIFHIQALAYKIIEKRKVVADVSTFKALSEIGLNTKSSLTYIRDRMSENTSEEDTQVIPSDNDIANYVMGSYDESSASPAEVEAHEILENYIKGEVNLDTIVAGKINDGQRDVTFFYRYLYAAHFCKFKMSLEELDAVVENLEQNIVQVDGYDYLKLLKDGSTLLVPCDPIDGEVQGYKADVINYKLKMAEQCCGFCNVTMIAREYGCNEAKRHVAFACESVNLYDRGVKNAILYLEDLYETQMAKYLPEHLKSRARAYKKTFAYKQYFRIAKTGTLEFPEEFGGEIIQVPANIADICYATVKQRIEITSFYCSKLYENNFFTHYCVNADITPEAVIPRGDAKIPVVSLRALWFDWNKYGTPQLYPALQEAIGENIIPWTYLWNLSVYLHREISDITLSQLINKYESMFESGTVLDYPHPEYLMYPGLEETFHVSDYGDKKIHLAHAYFITKKDYPEHGQVKEVSRSASTLKKFTGFSVEDFVGVPNVVDIDMPEGDKLISVNGDTISIVGKFDLPIYTIAELYKSGEDYPIINPYGRKYIFRDVDRVLWEVTI